MKLTCLSQGNGYHCPPCHILDLCGFRILIDCPVDLSATIVFSPIPTDMASTRSRKRKEDEGGEDDSLIRAIPWYKTAKNLHLWDASLIDVVLVSSPMGMLGLPFLTRNRRFTAKIYVTDAAARIGKIMMEELVSLHAEFVQFYGPDEDVGSPEWMKLDELEKLPVTLREIVMGQAGEELGSWMPLYSAADINECMKKVHTVKYAEECCYNGTLILKPLSSGLEMGSSNWTIRGPRRNITYLSGSLFESSHAANFDYHDLRGNDVILFSDFSSLHAAPDSLNTDQVESDDKDLSSNHPLSGWNSGASAETNEGLVGTSESSNELEKLSFICSCIVDSVKGGGSVLIPLDRLGIALQLMEQLSESLESSNLKVPIFMISPVAEETLAFANAVPEWLSKGQQQKLFSGEPLFSHTELIKGKKLLLHPTIHASSLLMAWQESCIVFSPHWSLRHGPVPHLLRRWCANENCLLILEQGVDADVALSPFKPMAMKVLQCSFLSGIMMHKVHPLLEFLQPKLVLFPEELQELRAMVLSKGVAFSFLYYTQNTTVHVPKLEEDFEVCLSTELAFQLQPRKMQQHNIANARLHGRLRLSNGKFLLVPTEKMTKLSDKTLHWGSVDHNQLLQVLQKTGMNARVHKDDTTDCEIYYVHVNGSEAVAIQSSASETLIAATSDTLATNIYEAFSSVCDGI